MLLSCVECRQVSTGGGAILAVFGHDQQKSQQTSAAMSPKPAGRVWNPLLQRRRRNRRLAILQRGVGLRDDVGADGFRIGLTESASE